MDAAMRRVAAVALLIAAADPSFFSILLAQSEPAPRFEVTSVRRAIPGETGGRVQFLPGGRFVAQNVALNFLLQQVYGVRDFQIVAEPKWQAIIADSRDSRYYIDGRGPASATREQLQEMAKTLLAERFGLKLRIEQRAVPVYALVVSERGVKGARAADGKPGGIASMARGWMRGTGATTASLARALTSYVDRPVVDRTKLDDLLLDFDLTWTPVELAAAASIGGVRVTRADDADREITPSNPGASLQDPGCPSSFEDLAKRLEGVKVERFTCPSVYTAVEEQLGLKLEAQNAPTDVLVIESVQVPTEN
jgi:uncharacterized protein (TIGR03435 family)